MMIVIMIIITMAIITMIVVIMVVIISKLPGDRDRKRMEIQVVLGFDDFLWRPGKDSKGCPMGPSMGWYGPCASVKGSELRTKSPSFEGGS